MEGNAGEKAIVDEINLEWDAIPVKYDNFTEIYKPDETGEQDQEEMQKMRELQNGFKYALTFKQMTLGNATTPEEPLMRAQTITEEHISEVQNNVQKKKELVRVLDEAILALEDVTSHETRSNEEKTEEKQELLKLIKKDFIKQQRYLLTAVQKYFPNNETLTYEVLNKLFDAYFESLDKYIDASGFPQVVVQGLETAGLIDREEGHPNKIKLRQIL